MNDLLLSVVIPARNEAGSIVTTIEALITGLDAGSIPFEIIVVDDGCTDSTAPLVRELSSRRPEVRIVENRDRHGFGMAVRAGISQFRGDAVAIVMADGSDSAADLVRYYRKLEEGYDCVFGSRFMPGGRVTDYPFHKLIINRIANRFIGLLFTYRFNDTTNAFKCYRRHAIQVMQPLISPHFNLTVEMPIKAIIRGFSYAVVPISWSNRTSGVSKLKLKEMGSRYLFIVLYLWFEKYLSRGDYLRAHPPEEQSAQSAHTNLTNV
jgi:dolichol-phosphate mannosyltransferase